MKASKLKLGRIAMELPEIHYKYGIAFLRPWNIGDTLYLSVYSILGN